MFTYVFPLQAYSLLTEITVAPGIVTRKVKSFETGNGQSHLP